MITKKALRYQAVLPLPFIVLCGNIDDIVL